MVNEIELPVPGGVTIVALAPAVETVKFYRALARLVGVPVRATTIRAFWLLQAP